MPSNADARDKKARRKRKFTPVTRQLCLQHHARGFGYKRISKATGIPISTIKYHIRKERDGGECSQEDRVSACSPGAMLMPIRSHAVHKKVAPPPSLLLGSRNAAAQSGFAKSAVLVEMLHAVHDVMKKNVYAFARALQNDTHGAPGMMNATDPHMLTLALNLLLQDQWTDRQELARLGRLLLQRLHAARDFLKSALSLCQKAFAAGSTMGVALSGGGSSLPATTPKATYWECPVCAKRLIHTGKCAHQTRCLKKCKVLLSQEQLQAATAKAASTSHSNRSSSPDELKQRIKHAVAALKPGEKCHQVRYMQLVVAVNTTLEQAIDADPTALLDSSEVWRAVKAGPNPVIAALALVSLALRNESSAQRKKKTLVWQYAHKLSAKVADMVREVEEFLVRCVSNPGAESPHGVHDDALYRRHAEKQCVVNSRMPAPPPTVTCTCHRVRISALIHHHNSCITSNSIISKDSERAD